ncbi:MAG: nuclear transport factor 2 family protein [Sphingomicrobium sp.]
MKTKIVAAAVTLAACTQQGQSTAQDTNAASEQRPSEEDSRATIEQAEREWAALATTRNPQVLERILAEDYVGVADDGTVRNKAQEIQYWNELPLAASAEPPKTTYRQFGDTVLFHGDQILNPRDGNPDRILWTDVWMFRDGKWQAIGSQNATVPPGQ